MTLFLRNYAGIIGGVLSFSAYLIYIVSTVRGKTKPSRSTWWILTLVGALILWSSYSMGAVGNIWIQLSYVLGPCIIGILSLWYGEGTGLSRLDIVCLVGASISGALWVIFNSPLIAFLGSIIVDCIGLIPTIRKAWREPEEEDPNAWLLETVSSIINALGIVIWFSLIHTDWVYALYLVLVNSLLTALLWRKRLFSKLQKVFS